MNIDYWILVYIDSWILMYQYQNFIAQELFLKQKTFSCTSYFFTQNNKKKEMYLSVKINQINNVYYFTQGIP